MVLCLHLAMSYQALIEWGSHTPRGRIRDKNPQGESAPFVAGRHLAYILAEARTHNLMCELDRTKPRPMMIYVVVVEVGDFSLATWAEIGRQISPHRPTNGLRAA